MTVPARKKAPLGERFRDVFAVAGHFAFAIAVVWALITWNGFEQTLGAVLPWTLHNLVTGVAFFASLAIAWVLGTLGGTLGWFTGRRLGKAALGAAAGVAGLWGGIALTLGLLGLDRLIGLPRVLIVPLSFVF